MKTFFSTLTLFLAICGVSGAVAQSQGMMQTPAADTMILSERIDGNYLVRRYVVHRPADSDYAIRYQISMAKLMPALDGNKQELSDLDAFMANVMKDTLMNVRWVEITGYASPDGALKYNETLAASRTADFVAYVNKKYDFSRHFKVKTTSVADDWTSARKMIAQSDVPDKAGVLKVIDGNWTHMEKEAALKRMPGVWDYLKAKILPPMRRVEVVINYGEGNIVEQRTMIAKPKPQPEPACEPCVVVDETITGIIVEMPGSDVDFSKMTREERKMAKQEMKQAEKTARELEKFARKEAKAAEKFAKKLEKNKR